MVADGMLTRKRYREVPPRVDYELTERARELMPILGELARWGYEWAWSPPRATKWSTSARSSGSPRGCSRVRTGATASSSWSRTPSARATTRSRCQEQGGASLEERPAGAPDARVAGVTDAWVRAFSPDRDRTGLDVVGDHQLAESLLDGLAAVGALRPGLQKPRSWRTTSTDTTWP